MNKIQLVIVSAVTAALVAVGVGTSGTSGTSTASTASSKSASADKGRRLSGPFCVSLSTGVVRSIAEIPFQACRAGEVRKVGVAIPCPTLTYAKNHTCGPSQGPRGAKGAPGKNGTNGTNGKDSTVPGPPGPAGTGAKGDKGDTGAASTVPGPPGPASTVPGPPGPKGDSIKGDKGDTGAASTVPGPPGKDGKNGLGDGYRWLCYDGNSGHGMADGGTGAYPVCNNGTKLAFKVVTLGAAIVNP